MSEQTPQAREIAQDIRAAAWFIANGWLGGQPEIVRNGLAADIADELQAERDRQAAGVAAIIELIRFKANQYAKGGDMTFSHLLALADQITDGWHLRIDELRQRAQDAYGDDEEAADVT